MSRSRYLVTYDICDDKRLRRVFRVLNDFGDHIQYSVFLCDLNDSERVRLEATLRKALNHREDQVLMFRLGSATIDVDDKVHSIGRDFTPPCRTIVV